MGGTAPAALSAATWVSSSSSVAAARLSSSCAGVDAPDDDRGDLRPAQQPGEGHPSRRDVELRRDPSEHGQDLRPHGGIDRREGPGRASAVAAPGQVAAGQRAPHDDARRRGAGTSARSPARRRAPPATSTPAPRWARPGRGRAGGRRHSRSRPPSSSTRRPFVPAHGRRARPARRMSPPSVSSGPAGAGRARRCGRWPDAAGCPRPTPSRCPGRVAGRGRRPSPASSPPGARRGAGPTTAPGSPPTRRHCRHRRCPPG